LPLTEQVLCNTTKACVNGATVRLLVFDVA